MDRKSFLQGAGCMFGVGVFGAVPTIREESKILEVTLSWKEISPPIYRQEEYSFMGQRFRNGDKKRFKLLQEYEVLESVCSCCHCRYFNNDIDTPKLHYDKSPIYPALEIIYPVLRKKEDFVHSEACTYSGGKIEVYEELTFHMFLDGRDSGSYQAQDITIKWETVKDDGTPYIAEKVIRNPQRGFHT